MNSAITKQDNGTIELLITVPWNTVSEAYDKLIDERVKDAEVSGFRKGKAPRKLVEEKLDPKKIYEDVIRNLVPEVYDQAVKEHALKPVIIPRIELKEAEEKKDWVVRALTAERPKVTLNDYKAEIRQAKTDKHKKIWVPGDKPEKPAEDDKDKRPSLELILKALSGAAEAIISPLIIEAEVNKMLSDLIDQTKKLGMTVEQYLAAKGKTTDVLRKEYEQQAAETLKLEFALEDIADLEGILVSDDDIDTVIKSAKSDDEKKSMERQKYYIASVLRRQKTLDYLAGL